MTSSQGELVAIYRNSETLSMPIDSAPLDSQVRGHRRHGDIKIQTCVIVCCEG